MFCMNKLLHDPDISAAEYNKLVVQSPFKLVCFFMNSINNERDS